MQRIIELPSGWDQLTHQVLDAARASRLVVLLDGGSGAGKTTVAEELHNRIVEALGPVQLVSLDEVYPGWGGLAPASDWVWQQILHPTNPSQPVWNWSARQFIGRRDLDPLLPIIVEGCGALSRASALLATSRLWCDQDAETRRERALARDGEIFAPHWDAWAAQEAEHWLRNRPRELADLVIRGQ